MLEIDKKLTQCQQQQRKSSYFTDEKLSELNDTNDILHEETVCKICEKKMTSLYLMKHYNTCFQLFKLNERISTLHKQLIKTLFTLVSIKNKIEISNKKTIQGELLRVRWGCPGADLF